MLIMGALKYILIVLGIIVIGVLGTAGYFYNSLSKTVDAQLHIESGYVQVNGNSVTGNVKLRQGDVVETSNGLATIILHESVLISLNENTKTTLEDLLLKHPKISQETGKSWNKFTRLSGVEGYSIKDSESVASVRSTAFQFSNGKLIGFEGEVDYNIADTDFVVEERKVVEIVDGIPVKRDITAEELAEVKQSLERQERELKYLRELEVKKYTFIINKFTTEETVMETLEQADSGEKDIEELRKLVPVKIKSTQKVVDLTNKIKETKQQIESL